ncbi:MAG: NTP transferase domain-containing protein [Isosphaeraceae bacterium]
MSQAPPLPAHLQTASFAEAFEMLCECPQLPASDAEARYFASLEESFESDPVGYCRWIEDLGQERLRQDHSLTVLRTLVTELLERRRVLGLSAYACAEAMQICLGDLIILDELDRTDVPAAAVCTLRDELLAASLDLVARLLRNMAMRAGGLRSAGHRSDGTPARQLADLFRKSSQERVAVRDDGHPVLVVATAGRGTRLRSTIPKGLIPVGGVPMATRVVTAAKAAGFRQIIFILRYRADVQRPYLSRSGAILVQREALGTAHSAMAALTALPQQQASVVISYSDMPFITPAAFTRARTELERADVGFALSTFAPANQETGRVIHNGAGDVVRVEQSRLVGAHSDEGDGGLYALRRDLVFEALGSVTNDNVRREYNLPDVVANLVSDGVRVRSAQGSPKDFQSVNTSADLVMARLRAQTGAIGESGWSDDQLRAVARFFTAYRSRASAPAPASVAGPPMPDEAPSQHAAGLEQAVADSIASVKTLIGPVLDLRSRW